MGHFRGKIKWNLKLCMHTETNLSVFCFCFLFFFLHVLTLLLFKLCSKQEFEEQIVATYWIDNGALSIIVTLFVLIFMLRLWGLDYLHSFV